MQGLALIDQWPDNSRGGVGDPELISPALRNVFHGARYLSCNVIGEKRKQGTMAAYDETAQTPGDRPQGAIVTDLEQLLTMVEIMRSDRRSCGRCAVCAEDHALGRHEAGCN